MTPDDHEDALAVTRVDVPIGARVVVHGELTMATRDELATCLMEAIDEGHDLVEIDLGAVKFMDSQGLWALMRARQHADDGTTLKIVDASPPVRRLLQMTTLDTLFGYAPEP